MAEKKDIVPGVSAATFPGGEGIWVTDKNRCVGLVEDSTGGYLVIYKDQTGGNLPLAITADGIQLPGQDSGKYRFISWDDLYALVEKSKG